jgi:thioredoxin reductase (NADPH)
MSTVVQTDVVVVGAGPVGLFAVFQCGMLKLRCHVVDALDAVGGQCAALYPEKPIYDIPAYPRILAADLVANLQEQAAPFAPVYHLNQRVERLERLEAEQAWLVKTSTGTLLQAKAVIIAAGAGAFGPNRPPLVDIEDYEGGTDAGVQYFVKKREDFRGKKLVIAGGGDSAVDWALSLADLAAEIYLVHRRPKFRAAPESVAQLDALVAAGKVQLVVPYQLSSLQGDGGRLNAVVVEDFDGGKRVLDADHLLAFFGLSMDLGPIADWGLNLHRQHIEVAPVSGQTNLPGIFAVGDIASYSGKLKLILTGFAEAAAAAHAIYPLIHPDVPLHFEYSTTKGVAA